MLYKRQLHIATMSNELVICGAAYGRSDVTGKIRSLRKDQKLFVKASNDVFGDSWSAENKSLVVVYKYLQAVIVPSYRLSRRAGIYKLFRRLLVLVVVGRIGNFLSH
jgi:hypothetical protein